MEHIKIENKDSSLGNYWQGTKVSVGGREIQNVRSVDFRVAVDEVPTFTIETMAKPDIEMDGAVIFKYHPETVSEAAEVILKEFCKESDLYMGLVASIESAIIECEDEYEMARNIADRILGIEN